MNDSHWHKIGYGAVSALPDFLLKHGPDTLSKRRQVYGHKSLLNSISPGGRFISYRALMFSMTHGALPGFCYKVMQRASTYPLNDYYSHMIHQQMVDSHCQSYPTMTALVSGVLVGWSEPVLLLWADHLKVAAQTNPDAQASIWRYARENRHALYRGFWVTASRNTLGSSLFFGGTAWVRERLNQSSELEAYAGVKIALSAMAGTLFRVAGPYFVDSVKTIIQ